MDLFTARDRRNILHVFCTFAVLNYAYRIAQGVKINLVYEVVSMLVTLTVIWIWFTVRARRKR